MPEITHEINAEQLDRDSQEPLHPYNKNYLQGAGVGRNDPCGCGSGRKYKKCCLPAETADQPHEFGRSKKMSRAKANKIAAGILAQISRGNTIESCAQAVFDSREPKSELIVVDKVQVPYELIKQLGEALAVELESHLVHGTEPEE